MGRLDHGIGDAVPGIGTARMARARRTLSVSDSREWTCPRRRAVRLRGFLSHSSSGFVLIGVRSPSRFSSPCSRLRTGSTSSVGSLAQRYLSCTIAACGTAPRMASWQGSRISTVTAATPSGCASGIRAQGAPAPSRSGTPSNTRQPATSCDAETQSRPLPKLFPSSPRWAKSRSERRPKPRTTARPHDPICLIARHLRQPLRLDLAAHGLQRVGGTGLDQLGQPRSVLSQDGPHLLHPSWPANHPRRRGRCGGKLPVRFPNDREKGPRGVPRGPEAFFRRRGRKVPPRRARAAQRFVPLVPLLPDRVARTVPELRLPRVLDLSDQRLW